MRKLISYSVVFLLGVGICAIALRTFGAVDNNASATAQSKQIVLAALTKPVPPLSSNAATSVIADAAAKVEPSVVTIDTESKPIPVANPMGGDPFFRQFFGNQMPQQQTQREQGAASGIIISADGYILTNNHVVEGADTVKVNLADGKGYRAKVVGADPTTDIAVVKVDAPGETLTPAQFGDSGSLRVGDMVIAVGNPLDIGTTVTFGIVSALGHRNGTLNAGPRPLASNIIQTDAAINPGNSGGALADIDGRVIGINEAIYSPTGVYSGIGFAIPISAAKDIAAELIKDGKVTRGYIGIAYSALKSIDQQDRAQVGIDLKGDDGVVISQVYPNSPASKAGLREYDVILEANRQQLTDTTTLQAQISKLKPGDHLVLLVHRNGQNVIVPVTVEQMPQDFGSTPTNGGSDGQNNPDGQSPDDQP